MQPCAPLRLVAPMSAPKKIPPNLKPTLLEQRGQGMTSDQSAAWLLATHGIKCSGAAVRAILKTLTAERSEITREVTRAKLAPQVTSDLDRLDAIRRRAREIERAAKDAPETALRAQRVQAEVLDKKLHYAGADAGVSAVQGVVILPAEDASDA